MEYIFRASYNADQFTTGKRSRASGSTQCCFRGLDVDGTTGSLQLLNELDLRAEIGMRRSLLASAGSEFDLDMTISAAERLKVSRANMKKTLGLDELAIAEMDALGRELVNDDDLSTSAAASTASSTASVNVEQLSARERQALKRKARLATQVATKKQCRDSGATGSGTGSASTVSRPPAYSLESYLEAIENDVQWFSERMKENLLHPNWQTRHGAILALRAVLQLGLPAKVSEEGGLVGWLELLLADLLLVLGLDRFGDFVGDQVVSPVKETAAQLFAVLFRHVAGVEAFKTAMINKHLRVLLGFDLWPVRHGGLLALKYVVASSTGQVAVEVIQSVGQMVCGLLQDSDEDVRAVAADVLSLLLGEESCTTAASALFDSMVESLAFVLIDLDSSASLNIASVFELLARVLGLGSGASVQDLVNLTPEALIPFIRHASVKVRLQVVRVFEALPVESVSVSVFRQFMQSLALELDRVVADATLHFCEGICARMGEKLLLEDRGLLQGLLRIAATALGLPYNSAGFVFPGDRVPEQELSFKKSDMMLIGESEAARQRLYLAKALALLPPSLYADEGILTEWAGSNCCLHHLLLHWLNIPKPLPSSMPSIFLEESSLFAALSVGLDAGGLKCTQDLLDLVAASESTETYLSLQSLHSRLKARYKAAYCQGNDPQAPDTLLTAISEDDNATLQEQFASELVASLQNPELPVEVISSALQRIAKLVSLDQLCPAHNEDSDEGCAFVYGHSSWTEYALGNSATWRGGQLVLSKIVENEQLLRNLMAWIEANFEDTWMIDLVVGLMKGLNGGKRPVSTVNWYDLLESAVFSSKEPWKAAAALGLLVLNDEGDLLATILTRGIGRSESIAALCVILELILRGESVVIPVIPILLQRVLELVNDQDAMVRKHATLAFSQLMKLAPLGSDTADVSHALSPELAKRVAESRAFLKHLQGPPTELPDFVPPCAIGITLRPYQQAGLNWLAFLRRYNLHGALCDDMGLGKTLQTLCIVASDHFERKGQAGLRSLIVCPSSLAGHWEAEIKQYCPSLSTPLLYMGTAAERRNQHLPKLEAAEIVITSYDVLRTDGEHFAALGWNYCVLDEGHLIKNPKTKLSMSVRQLKAQHRLLLSGTPLQNNLLELWSLFDFLMPGYLGTDREFAEKYSKPIAILQQQQQPQGQPSSSAGTSGAANGASKWTQKDFDEAEHRLQLLHKQVLPFILRRMKEDVLQDLPPKIIQDCTCSMSSVQQLIYDDLLQSTSLRSEISSYLQSRFPGGGVQKEAEEGRKAGKPPMHVFQALQYLRKLCVHPSLVLSEGHPLEGPVCDELQRQHWTMMGDLEVAPKFLMLKELLVECGLGESAGADDMMNAGERHRVLIFAQQKHTLDLVEQLVFKEHLPHLTYLRLDGSVDALSRYPIVTKFNSDPSIDVLLLTTHVGGLGLNLTAADTVIFMDPDWNPARDLQAMDRAHRLGQKRVVTVYRLLLKDSLEERIMGMQRWKLLLASSVVSQQNASINSEGLLDLFEARGEAQRARPGKADGVEESASEVWLKKHRGPLVPGVEDADYEAEYAAEFDIKSFQDRSEAKDTLG